MSIPQNHLDQIFTKAADAWQIAVKVVEQEYADSLFTIIPREENVYAVNHQIRTDLVVEVLEEF